MKKIVSFILAVCVMMCGMGISAAEISEDVLLKVKEKIDIPDNLTKFEYSEDKYDDMLIYDFSWRDEEYSQSLYVSSDRNGKIVSYGLYLPFDYSDGKNLISYNISDGQEIADAFVKKAYGEYFEGNDVLKLEEDKSKSTYSGKYKIFTYVYQRYYNKVKVNGNYVTVRVRATKDDIYVQSANASLDESAVFYEGDTINPGQYEYSSKFPIKLFYQTDYSDDKAAVKLFYKLENGYVSKIDANIVTAEYFSRYAVTNEDAASDKMAMGGALSRNTALKPYEKEEIEKMESLVKAEEVLKAIKVFDILKITDDMEIARMYTYKDGEEYFSSFTLEDGERRTYVSYNAESGEVMSISSYFDKYYDEAASGSGKKDAEKEWDIPKEKIEEFADKLSGGKTAQTDIEFTTNGKRSTMSAVRLVNDVRFDENNISVIYDAAEGAVTDYHINWTDDVSDFPKPEEAIGFLKAEAALFEYAPVETVYVKTGERYIPAITSAGAVIDALTGSKAFGYNGYEKTAYTDIENHWAQKMIEALFEHDIYLEGELFKPDETICQADMIRLLSGCENAGIILFRDDKEICEWGHNNGYVDIAEPEKLVTREEVFNAMVKVIGYGDIYKFDIFKSSFTDHDDFEYTGGGELLKAMGIITGDEARPKDGATRAEVAAMVYRYLAR